MSVLVCPRGQLCICMYTCVCVYFQRTTDLRTRAFCLLIEIGHVLGVLLALHLRFIRATVQVEGLILPVRPRATLLHSCLESCITGDECLVIFLLILPYRFLYWFKFSRPWPLSFSTSNNSHWAGIAHTVACKYGVILSFATHVANLQRCGITSHQKVPHSRFPI